MANLVPTPIPSSSAICYGDGRDANYVARVVAEEERKTSDALHHEFETDILVKPTVMVADSK